MKRQPLLLALLLAAPALSAAQWSAEPKAVFGIELGAPAASVRQCPDEDWKNVPPACQVTNRYAPTLVHLYGLPSLGLPFTAELKTHDGRILSVNVMLKQQDFQAMRVILEERYGPPNSTRTDIVTAGNGGRFESAVLEWRGATTSIVAMERVGTIDRSEVRFYSNELEASRAADRERATRGSASKL